MAKHFSISRLAFGVSCLFLAFLGGFVVCHFRLFPHAILAPALDQAEQLLTGKGATLHHQTLARHDFVGVVVHDQDNGSAPPTRDPLTSGLILLTSYWPEHDWRPGIRLIDRSGKVLHDWDIDTHSIWPESPYHDGSEIFCGQETYVHGTYLFENGDVLLNVEYRGLVRLDAAGKVLWHLDRHTHHAISRDDDGNFWVCEMRWITDISEALTRFFGLIPPFTEDRILKVSPAGEVLQEISMLDLICHGEFKSLLWRAGPEAPTRTIDPLHLNDIEPLSAAMANQYPLFAAGDLVVSLYQLNLVFVFDPKTKRVKWHSCMSLVHQHDPDFIGGGRISVFNNNADGTPDGAILGGTQLLAFDTNSPSIEQIYPSPSAKPDHERKFYTPVGGKAQLLDGGHWLLTEAVAGRVFEIDREGRTIWEWGQQRREHGREISEVLEGTWYPYSAEQVASWTHR